MELSYFRAASEFLTGKNIVTKEEYKAMTDTARMKAFTVSGYTSLEVLEAFLSKLDEAVKNGTTKEQFQEEMNEFLVEKGYDPMNPWKSDTIFRTNLQTAYNAGHYKSMTRPAVLAARPYWQYVTAGDGEVRESHAMMAGRVYPADHPIWNIWFPPNGYKCRCTIVSLSQQQVTKRGLHVWESAPAKLQASGKPQIQYPDKGFNGNPAKQVWQPDLSGVRTALRKLYKDRTRTRPK